MKMFYSLVIRQGQWNSIIQKQTNIILKSSLQIIENIIVDFFFLFSFFVYSSSILRVYSSWIWKLLSPSESQIFEGTHKGDEHCTHAHIIQTARSYAHAHARLLVMKRLVGWFPLWLMFSMATVFCFLQALKTSSAGPVDREVSAECRMGWGGGGGVNIHTGSWSKDGYAARDEPLMHGHVKQTRARWLSSEPPSHLSSKIHSHQIESAELLLSDNWHISTTTEPEFLFKPRTQDTLPQSVQALRQFTTFLREFRHFWISGWRLIFCASEMRCQAIFCPCDSFCCHWRRLRKFPLLVSMTTRRYIGLDQTNAEHVWLICVWQTSQCNLHGADIPGTPASNYLKVDLACYTSGVKVRGRSTGKHAQNWRRRKVGHFSRFSKQSFVIEMPLYCLQFINIECSVVSFHFSLMIAGI